MVHCCATGTALDIVNNRRGDGIGEKAAMSGSCDDRGVQKCRAFGAEISVRPMSDISAMFGHAVSGILRAHQGLDVHRHIVGDGGGYRVENRVFALSLGLAVGGGLRRRRHRSASSPVLLAFEASYARIGCAPVPSGDLARAALTIPFVAGPSTRVPIGDTRAVLREPVMLIAGQLALLGNDRCGESYA